MIISITHEHDLDGIGSQAILLRYHKIIKKTDDIKLEFAHYLDFVQKIEKILNSDNLPSQLIISDIGFNKDFNELFPIFEKVKGKKCKIFWFDHHLVGAEITENLKKLVHLYINDTNKCATEIIKDYYLPNDPIAIKIAEFARDTDFRTEKYKLAAELQLIIGYNRGEENYKNKTKIVELLSQGKFQNSWFKDQLKILKNWYNEEVEYAANHTTAINIENFGDVIISYAKLGGGKITLLLREKFPEAKAFIGIDIRYNEIIIHSDFINCRDFSREFKGGGHIVRAGFKYPNIFIRENVLNNEFIQDIERTIIKYQK